MSDVSKVPKYTYRYMGVGLYSSRLPNECPAALIIVVKTLQAEVVLPLVYYVDFVNLQYNFRETDLIFPYLIFMSF